MANESVSVFEVLELMGKAAKAVTKKTVKKILGQETSNASMNSRKKSMQDSGKQNPAYVQNADNSIVASLRLELNHMRKNYIRLENEQKILKERCDELFKRIDSITQEYLDDIETLRKDLGKNSDTISCLNTNDELKSVYLPQDSSNCKQYVEPSASGDVLLNALKSPNSYGNFIELNTDTGTFTMVLTNDIIDYILNNRDYVLGCCHVSSQSSQPIGIRVDEHGQVSKSNVDGEWKVTKKMKITLY